MELTGVLREMFEYHYWARDRQLRACAVLTPEQFLRPLGSSYSSVRDTIVHLLAAEWVWQERWRGRSPTAADAKQFSPENFPDLATIERRWPAVERDVRDFLDGLSAETLERNVTYTNLEGKQWTYPLWRALFHLINHQTYHRGQVTTLLRQLGAQAVPIDFLVAHDLGFKLD